LLRSWLRPFGRGFFRARIPEISVKTFGKSIGERNVGLTIWGRANSVNVQKALWCLAELDIAYERIDAGMAFGRNNEADYLAMNPNGRVPTLVDGDFVLWESNSIMRYLCLAYGKGTPIYPDAPKRRAAVDRWLDWTLSTVQPVDRPVFWAIIRTPPEKQDWVQIQKDADAEAPVWAIADRQLSTRRFMEGDQFTIADIAVGAYARRWLGFKGIKQPKFAHVERWFAEIAARPAFAKHLGGAMS
jgi:glutathione S-transferase